MSALWNFLRTEWKTFVALSLIGLLILIALHISQQEQPSTSRKLPPNIIPGQRLGPISLGMSRAEVLAILGPDLRQRELPLDLLLLQDPQSGLEIFVHNDVVTALRCRTTQRDQPAEDLVSLGLLSPPDLPPCAFNILPNGIYLPKDTKRLHRAVGTAIGRSTPAPNLKWHHHQGFIAVTYSDRPKDNTLREFILTN